MGRPGWRRVGAALIVAMVSGSLATGPSAHAATAVRCSGAANVFAVKTNGDLVLYQHDTPGSGTFDWAGGYQIGRGWDGRTLAGPSGLVYSITPGGELRQFRWNGAGWDTYAGGSQYRVLAQGWQPYAAELRDLITIDPNGTIYRRVNDSSLARDSVVDGVLTTVVLSWSDFGDLDALTAIGPDQLVGRGTNGNLYRYRYDQVSKRLYDTIQPAAAEWDRYARFFSVGGGVLYGVDRSNGDLRWQRDSANADFETSWEGGPGRLVGLDWGGLRDLTATSNVCTQVSPTTTPRVTAAPVEFPPSAVTVVGGALRILHLDAEGRIVVLNQDSAREVYYRWELSGRGHVGSVKVHKWTNEPLGPETFAAIAATPDGAVHAYRSSHGDPEMGGWFTHTPTWVYDNNDLYAVDEGGRVWKSHTGQGALWKPFDVSVNLDGPLTSVRHGFGNSVVAGRSRTTGRAVALTWAGYGQKIVADLGGPEIVGPPALTIDQDNHVRVVATGADGKIWTAAYLPLQGTVGAWSEIPGVTSQTPPSACAGADGKVEVAVRDTAGKVHVATQQAPNSDQFGPWVQLGDAVAASPPVMFKRSPSRVVTFRDAQNAVYVYTNWSGSGSPFTGGPITIA